MACDVKFIEIYRIYVSLSPFLNYYTQVSQKFLTIYSIVAYSVRNVIGIPSSLEVCLVATLYPEGNAEFISLY